MKIVVLDGFTLNQGEPWDEIKACGDSFTVYDRTSPDEMLARAQGADVILTNKVIIGRVHFEQLPSLKYIGVLATGYNSIDVKAAKANGVVVSNIPNYCTASVTQMVFAHLLNIIVQVDTYSKEVKQGHWLLSRDFCYWNEPLTELASHSFGIIGLGEIGMATARVAIGFGMKVYAFTTKTQKSLPEGIITLPLDEIFRQSDVISLHCPLNDITTEIINKKNISLMKSSAIVINTGRGGLVNEADLAEALNTGRIRAAGVDVLSIEPPKADNPLLTARNCFITPHIAWATVEARKRLMKIAVNNLRAFIEGKPQNNVAV